MTTLSMPKNYVEINSEEMTYINGGWTTICSESTLTKAVDAAVIIATFSLSGSWKVSQLVAKFGWTKVKAAVKTALIAKGISEAKSKMICDLMTCITGWSIGAGVAYLTDKYDASGDDGWIRF